MSYSILEPIPGWLDNDPSRYVHCTMQYQPTDPYLVTVDFGSDNIWLIGRDLLFDGLHGRTGEGDIVVWPTTRSFSRFMQVSNHVVFRLQPPQEPPQEITYHRGPLERFLHRTERVVPRGKEHRHIDLDALVSYLAKR